MKQILTLKEPVGKITTPSELFCKVKKINVDYDKEQFLVITLNSAKQIIKTHIVSVGILDASLIHPREVFKTAILDNANTIILAHNHPSGVLIPSCADKEITRLLVQAGETLGIPVIDHIIFNKKEYISLKNLGEFN